MKNVIICLKILYSLSTFDTIMNMKNLYDVQQFLKRFGIIIYVGKRLYDIELMKIELQRLYDAGLMERLDYLEADTVLRREHKQELEFLKKSEVE